jgi:hypothetical protein
MACDPDEHTYEPTEVTVKGVVVTVKMCSRCAWIDHSEHN